MSRILVTVSEDGLGRAAAESLPATRHDVVVHARNPERAVDLGMLVGRGARLLVGDFSDRRPYLLTALLRGPRRLVYLSSESHFGGRPSFNGVDWRGDTAGSYSDSKLFVTAVAAAVARLWPEVLSNAVDPGRVPTKTGGPRRSGRSGGGAPRTQEWLASGEEPKVLVSGGYWCTASRCTPRRAVHDETFQDRLLDALAEETGTSF